MIINNRKVHLSNEIRAAFALVERQFNLTKRYFAWEFVFLFYSIVNTLTIGLIAVGMGNGNIETEKHQIMYLIIGALMWGFLSVIFNEISCSIALER